MSERYEAGGNVRKIFQRFWILGVFIDFGPVLYIFRLLPHGQINWGNLILETP